MNRPSRVETNLKIAEIIAMRGTCRRLKVGAVITLNNRIISSGYNGPAGSKHCVELNCDLTKKCEHAVHAEQNAIAAASKAGVSTDGAIIYVTHEPCLDCAKLIIQAGIIGVLYLNEYVSKTSKSGSDILLEAGIECQKIVFINLEDIEDEPA